MLEVLRYLRDNAYRTFIVTGVSMKNDWKRIFAFE
jgi:hypothetical protein